jgi:predicted O-methyltransferase YrrM
MSPTVLASTKSAVNRVIFDSNECTTDLCRIGARFKTDKSPLNDISEAPLKFRHAYTPIYDLLLAPMRHKPITVAEIGIFYAAGLLMFRDYFSEAKIYGFEFNLQLIENAKKLQMRDTSIDFIDVADSAEIDKAFGRTEEKYDLIVDDATHRVDDQVRVIRCCTKFLKRGGILIIEDIFDDSRAPEHKFTEVLSDVGNEYCSVNFLLPKNRATMTGEWNNEKLLVMIKK